MAPLGRAGRGRGTCSDAGEPFVYAYYDGIDKVAHIHGFGAHYDAELVAADRLVADLRAALPERRGPGRHRRPRSGPGGTGGLARRCRGRGGVRRHDEWRGPVPLAACPARPGTECLAERARGRYRDEAWVWTIDELERGRLVRRAPDARPCAAASATWRWCRSCRSPIWIPADTGEMRLVCRHGSLTSAEMLVPCLAAAHEE